MKHFLPLTKRDKQVAKTILAHIDVMIVKRAADYQRNTLTHKELHSLSVQIQKLSDQIGAAK